MRLSLVQRQAALAGIALLAAVVSLALTSGRRHESTLPPAIGSYTALAGSSGAGSFGHRTKCGQIIGPKTEGVANPVLPCGVKLYISYQGTHVLTQVIDRGPYVSGREFEITDALARRLGLTGVQRIRWSYAGTK